MLATRTLTANFNATPTLPTRYYNHVHLHHRWEKAAVRAWTHLVLSYCIAHAHTYDYYNYAKKCVINDSRLRGYDTTAINSKDNDDDADDNDD